MWGTNTRCHRNILPIINNRFKITKVITNRTYLHSRTHTLLYYFFLQYQNKFEKASRCNLGFAISALLSNASFFFAFTAFLLYRRFLVPFDILAGFSVKSDNTNLIRLDLLFGIFNDFLTGLILKHPEYLLFIHPA